MTHAMVISGVHVDEKTGQPIRFKVENSWGDDSGYKGYMVMGADWFDEYVSQQFSVQRVVDKACVDIDSSIRS